MVLKSRGIHSVEKAVDGLSVKNNDVYFAKLALRRVKGNASMSDEMLLQFAARSLRERGGVNPALVAHAIKKNNSVGDFHKVLPLICAKRPLRK